VNPCLNGGTCTALSHCTCASGWVGSICTTVAPLSMDYFGLSGYGWAVDCNSSGIYMNENVNTGPFQMWVLVGVSVDELDQYYIMNLGTAKVWDSQSGDISANTIDGGSSQQWRYVSYEVSIVSTDSTYVATLSVTSVVIYSDTVPFVGGTPTGELELYTESIYPYVSDEEPVFFLDYTVAPAYFIISYTYGSYLDGGNENIGMNGGNGGLFQKWLFVNVNPGNNQWVWIFEIATAKVVDSDWNGNAYTTNGINGGPFQMWGFRSALNGAAWTIQNQETLYFLYGNNNGVGTSSSPTCDGCYWSLSTTSF